MAHDSSPHRRPINNQKQRRNDQHSGDNNRGTRETNSNDNSPHRRSIDNQKQQGNDQHSGDNNRGTRETNSNDNSPHRRPMDNQKQQRNDQYSGDNNRGDRGERNNTQTSTGPTPRYTDHRRKRKQVLLVGTSNIKFTSAKHMAGHDRFIKKITKYSIKEARDYIDNFEGGEPDCTVFQITCNDVEKLENNELADQLDQLVEKTSKKFVGKRIIVSLPLPRRDSSLNEKIVALRAVIFSRLYGRRLVRVSDNSNLTHRGGHPLEGIMFDDKHLSKWGASRLSENIKEELDVIFN